MMSSTPSNALSFERSLGRRRKVGHRDPTSHRAGPGALQPRSRGLYRSPKIARDHTYWDEARPWLAMRARGIDLGPGVQEDDLGMPATMPSSSWRRPASRGVLRSARVHRGRPRAGLPDPHPPGRDRVAPPPRGPLGRRRSQPQRSRLHSLQDGGRSSGPPSGMGRCRLGVRLHETQYGLLEFGLVDPFGNTIDVGGPP